MTHPRTVLLSFALGTGHRQVADNLAGELERLGHDCEPKPMEDWVPWEYDLLFRRGYLFLALHVPKAWDAMYRSAWLAGRGRLVPPIMNGRALRAFEREGMGVADLVVATQYNAMEIAADWKRRHRADLKLAVVITDYDIYPLWARPEVDLYLVPHLAQAEGLRAQGVSTERIVVTGLPIARAFEDPVDGGATRAALALAPEAPTAMIFGGGGGMGPLKEFAQVAIERIDMAGRSGLRAERAPSQVAHSLGAGTPGSAPRVGLPQGHPGPHAGMRCGGHEGGCAQLDRSPLFRSTRGDHAGLAGAGAGECAVHGGEGLGGLLPTIGRSPGLPGEGCRGRDAAEGSPAL